MIALFILASSSLSAALGEEADFRWAKPIWPEGREEERNLSVRFRATLDRATEARVFLRITASTLYRTFVDGRFVGHGPARAAHGHFRVDVWDITDLVTSAPTVVAVEVAGYNVNSFYLLDQPAFLQAEVVAGEQVLAATGFDAVPFEASILDERVQRVQRYSFQRPFIEVYRLDKDHGQWRVDPETELASVPCAIQPAVRLLPRRVPYPTFVKRPVLGVVARGTVETGVVVQELWKDRSLYGIGPTLKGFPEDELDVVISAELQQMRSVPGTAPKADPIPRVALGEKEHCILDFGSDLSGFIGATVTCEEPCRVFFVFDEILSDGDVDFRRMQCVQAVTYEMPPGMYTVESFEPYTLRYLKLANVTGSCTVSDVYLREFTNPDVSGSDFQCSDERLERLFAAGRSTYAQNAVDVFMDCPSRERAGWLCDSFFTARVAFDLAGDTRVEKNFFENYLLPERFAYLPNGMLPMCYPSDHYDGAFIPSWGLWFVIQLEEYAARSGDDGLVAALRPRVLGLLDYFKDFRNADGLLESLQGWVFVEWSAANRFVQDVNYPNNMVYARALEAAGHLYKLEELCDQADNIREAIRRQSFDGTFFVDNAERKRNVLEATRNRTEVCQYFAFYFDLATPESHPELWRKLVGEFGPNRKQTGAHEDIHAANSFIGNMLRVELLSEHGRCAQILDESVDYLLYMAERTGTLWENITPVASCNHGFASHIVHTLFRDVLGLYRVDPVKKEVVIRFTDVPLEWCKGHRALPEGAVSLCWRREGEEIGYCVDAPNGYTVDVVNVSGKKIAEEEPGSWPIN